MDISTHLCYACLIKTDYSPFNFGKQPIKGK